MEVNLLEVEQLYKNPANNSAADAGGTEEVDGDE